MVFNNLHAKKIMLFALLSSCSMHAAVADDISTTDLLNLLVAEGVISEEKAVSLVKAVRKRAEKVEELKEADEQIADGTVRVPYVSEAVKEEIKSSVEMGLRTKVTEDVVAQAKSERWGVPDALPQWVNNIKISGDVRLRQEQMMMDKNNELRSSLDVIAANKAGGTTKIRKAFDNVEDDRSRTRLRARLNIKAKVTEGVTAGLRLVTGNESSPVSANQTLGSAGGKWDVNFDLAYLKYQNLSKSITAYGGKFKNPFLHTDLVWDSDYNPEGISVTWNFLRKDDMDDDFRQWDPFIKIGAFSIQEVHQIVLENEKIRFDDINDDKWMYAFQLGGNYEWFDQSRLSFATALYKYDNIRGKANPVGSDVTNVTAPNFAQAGNLPFNLLTPINSRDDAERFGLAADYTLWNTTLKYDYAGFSPYHIWAEFDYVRNIAFKKDEIADRFRNNKVQAINIPTRDEGYQLALSVGWPDLSQRGNWRAGIKYRHLEGDAVLDAYADSDFLLGGTNVKGYVISGDYAVKENVQIGAKWISADEMDAVISKNTAIDTLQVDLKTEF